MKRNMPSMCPGLLEKKEFANCGRMCSTKIKNCIKSASIQKTLF